MSYTGIIDNFRQLVSAGANNVAVIQALFVGDAAPGPPNVGLTTGGPQFTNQGGSFHCLRHFIIHFHTWCFSTQVTCD
jgi:hypothetical protein